MSILQQDERERRRKKRREMGGAAFDTTIPSPCVSVCQIDKASDLCLGCKRTIDEIREWMVLTADEKQTLLAQLAER